LLPKGKSDLLFPMGNFLRVFFGTLLISFLFCSAADLPAEEKITDQVGVAVLKNKVYGATPSGHLAFFINET